MVAGAPVTPEELARAAPGEATATVRARVARARARQLSRLCDTPWTTNATIPASGRAVDRLCPLDPEAAALLTDVAASRVLSPRTQHRLRRVARTLADLDPDHDPTAPIAARHVAEATQLRRLPGALED